LLELIVVMVILAIMLALVAPSLSSSLRAHHLEEAGVQLLAVTEYGRDQAISQGVPVDVWVNPANGQYGAYPKPGFPGDPGRSKQYTLEPDLHFDATGSIGGQVLIAAEFEPDGTLDPSATPKLRIVDRWNGSVSVTETADGYGYEVQKEVRR
jgi:type II secretory pathway pseudopilin PulG